MAELAASLVKDGDHIFLDASTTAVFVAKALKEKERLTVITNSMEILLELADVSGWNIISNGGVMKEGYLAFLGSKTDESIRSYYVDKVIFSCKALDLEWGIMESQEAFGSTKRAMIGSGRKKILVVDSSKFDQTAFCRFFVRNYNICFFHASSYGKRCLIKFRTVNNQNSLSSGTDHRSFKQCRY